MRVTNFLRSSSGNIAHIKKSATEALSRRNSTTIDAIPEADGHLHPATHKKVPDLAEAVEAVFHRRISIPFGKKDIASTVALDWDLESPPIIFHGNGDDSTGALVSGQMILKIKEDMVEVDSFIAKLKQHITHKKPFHPGCHDCQHQYTEVQKWQFISQPMILNKGVHLFPFSTLLDGHLAASMKNSLSAVTYEFTAEAVLSRTPGSSQTTNIKFEKTLDVKRSLPESEFPHHSIRLFPPTNIKSSAYYSTVIHPNSNNKVNLKLDGLVSLREGGGTLDIWRLKRVSWKLGETVKTIQPACDKHRPADASEESMTKTDNRLIGEKHLHGGWKSNYLSKDGTVDLEFDYNINGRRSHKTGQHKYACDSKTHDTEITHTLLIEIVVSKEYAPESKPHLTAQTGTGRILRMHYDVVLTDHPGVGVSWDVETPPLYQDVPASPPNYPEGPVSYEELEILENLHNQGASSPPRRASVSSEYEV